MKQAVQQLAEDFLSAIAFFALYALTGSLALGVGGAIAIGLTQLARRALTGRKIEPMQWMSLVLVVVLGGASLLFHAPRFLMVKPSIIHLAIAAVMLRRGWMTRYLPALAQAHLGQPIIDAAGLGWAALMAGLAVANLIIVVACSIATWAWFISVGALGAKLAAFGLQYVIFRGIITRRIVAARLAAVAAGDPA